MDEAVTWKKVPIAVASGLALTLLAAAGVYGSKVIQTSPPWVSVTSEHHDLKGIEIDLKKGQIIAAWDRCETAMRGEMKTDLVSEYQRQLAELQAEYQALTKDHVQYPLSCER